MEEEIKEMEDRQQRAMEYVAQCEEELLMQRSGSQRERMIQIQKVMEKKSEASGP